MSELVIGIDLGTTNSSVAIFKKGRTKVLENEDGDRITPSNVFFTDQNSVIVGRYARRMADAKPEYGVYGNIFLEMKRLIGRNFDDPFVQRSLNYLPYAVKDIENKPLVIVETKSKINAKTPQELCAYILRKIKKDVEDKLEAKVDKAVVTVPAYFNIEQREATLEACHQAGLTVMKLFSEPTAAALAYYFENHIEETNYSIVYDLGGGTFDVAILRRNSEKINILAVDGDTRLGGHDFDNLIVDYVCSYVQRNYGVDLKVDRRTIRRLGNECEEAKKCLSRTDSTTINLLGVVPQHRALEISLTKSQFEDMIESLCKRTVIIMDRCIDSSPIEKRDIKKVILAGGSTRIPLVQNLISQYFDGTALSKFVNPDECVAEGAALQAAMLSSHPDQEISDIKITDVTPLSIGTEDPVNRMEILIKRNAQIPTSNTVSFFSMYDQQTSMSFDIYEGERTDARKNHFLGRLRLTDLTPAPPGKVRVDATANLDQNGILTITAEEELSGKSKDLKIVYTRGNRSETEVQDAIISAKLAKEEDERFVKFASAKLALIEYCIDIMHQLDVRNLQSVHQSEYNRCEEVLQEVKTLEMDSIETVENLKTSLMQTCSPLVKKFDNDQRSCEVM